MATVTLSNHKAFIADKERTLLESAKSQGVVLEYSCRTGRCGICKAKVLRGDTSIMQGEQGLNEVELAMGYILTCCRSALGDLDLDVDDLGGLADIQTKTVPCRIDSIEKLAADVVKVVLRMPPSNSLRYISGQYIDVIGAEGVRRSYSLANAQREDGKLELHVRHVPLGVMSQYWFGGAQTNDLLRLEGPLGTFSLRNTKPGNLIFLATGTGIAPVKAMLETLATESLQLAGKNIYVYWGGRTESDLYWNPQLLQLDLNFIPVLSRADAQWTGRTGYVQDALLADNIDLAASVVYACGSDAMIHTAREQLLAVGLPSKNFYSDAFVSSN